MMSANYISSILFDNKLDKNSYLNDLPIIKYLLKEKELSFSSNVTFFVGENGTGKSTLLEAIAVAYGFNAEGGSKNFTFSTNVTHSELFEHITVANRRYAKDGFFLRAESLYNLATNIDDMDKLPSFDAPVIEGYGGISLHKQSHGESFFALMVNRFRGNGLYILDEPEAGIDLWSFSNLIKVFEKMRSEADRTILIISHQERILDIADEIVVIKDGRVVAFSKKDEILPELLKGTEGCIYYQV